MCSMNKKPIKIRKIWRRNPKTQIIPNKKILNRQEIKKEIKRTIDEN